MSTGVVMIDLIRTLGRSFQGLYLWLLGLFWKMSLSRPQETGHDSNRSAHALGVRSLLFDPATLNPDGRTASSAPAGAMICQSLSTTASVGMWSADKQAFMRKPSLRRNDSNDTTRSLNKSTRRGYNNRRRISDVVMSEIVTMARDHTTLSSTSGAHGDQFLTQIPTIFIPDLPTETDYSPAIPGSTGPRPLQETSPNLSSASSTPRSDFDFELSEQTYPTIHTPQLGGGVTSRAHQYHTCHIHDHNTKPCTSVSSISAPCCASVSLDPAFPRGPGITSIVSSLIKASASACATAQKPVLPLADARRHESYVVPVPYPEIFDFEAYRQRASCVAQIERDTPETGDPPRALDFVVSYPSPPASPVLGTADVAFPATFRSFDNPSSTVPLSTGSKDDVQRFSGPTISAAASMADSVRAMEEIIRLLDISET